MKKRLKKLNLSRRNFLTGTATLAGIAATASVVPITIANANHSEGKKGLPDFISWKDRDALIVHSDKGIETHRSAIGESLITPNRNIYIRNKMTSAGSLALKDNIAKKNAFIVDKLINANYFIYGKANLSEWANFRSEDSISGWSSYGGQTKHYLNNDYEMQISLLLHHIS